MSKNGEHVIWHGDNEENETASHRITTPEPQTDNPPQEQGEQ